MRLRTIVSRRTSYSWWVRDSGRCPSHPLLIPIACPRLLSLALCPVSTMLKCNVEVVFDNNWWRPWNPTLSPPRPQCCSAFTQLLCSYWERRQKRRMVACGGHLWAPNSRQAPCDNTGRHTGCLRPRTSHPVFSILWCSSGWSLLVKERRGNYGYREKTFWEWKGRITHREFCGTPCVDFLI